ncbi:signal peptidase II [Tropicimonas sp. IMCC34011]|uniref:signal peptidase II n=1 Tax=Tropicimonas sp. IMCC34011 TaxID=2248759 RepID=UPI000E25CD20|nr:signal peptidase II [Tropicimonas sp. IMCC34011]
MRTFWITSLLAFVVDQVSKYWVFYGLGVAGSRGLEVLPPYLVFITGYNTGINFGLFAAGEARLVLIGLALAISLMLAIWARRSFTTWVQYASAGLVVGGALGNALDRVFHPGVMDFLNMSCCGIDNPYIFNLADVFIFAGAAGLLLFTGERKKSP